MSYVTAGPTAELRPTPLRQAAAHWARILAVGGGLVTSLTTGGLLSADQAAALGAGLTALDVLYAAGVGVVTAAVGVTAAFRTARTGERQVTPVADPRDDQGRVLVPATAPLDPTGGGI
ncbi:MAG: hypothetical protein ACRDTZ_18690 [Pseudonocardiaceae bacterium]